MGDMADMLLDGEVCSWCGCLVCGPNACPVLCEGCWDGLDKDEKKQWTKVKAL